MLSPSNWKSRINAIRVLLRPFRLGAIAGSIALLFGFLMRLGGFAPFPPESAIEAFFSIVPASVQEPAVQTFGIFAKYIGLVAASLVSVIVYGIFGIVFEKYFVPRLSPLRFLSRFEKFLAYSLIPWIFFGIIVLLIAGQGPFGIFPSNTAFQASVSPVFFPFILLVSQLVFGATLYLVFRTSSVFLPPTISSTSAPRVGTASRNPTDIPKIENRPTSLDDRNFQSRRTFIEKGALVVGAVALAVFSISDAVSILSAESSVPIIPGKPINLQNAPSIFDDPRLKDLVDSEVTSNAGFYKVTINLFDPIVDLSTWALQLGGLISNGKTYSMSDLQKLPQVSQYTTFECVSNQVNGNLIGNAKWTGVRVSDLFNDAGGASANAQYVVLYSVDGYSVGVPLAKAMMPDSILAYKMNDAVLPTGHGFPLRAVFPGIYGMMSPKWIRKIELVDSVYSGYWQTRGWTNIATIETLAFISVPSAGSNVSLSQSNGSVILGGVAFAGDRGISKVEVSVDGGKTWQSAQIKPSISNLTWTLWAFDWHPSSTGNYNVYARATDGTSATQTSQRTGSFPNGATGYVTIPVNVVS